MPSGHHLRVLLADDHALIREGLRRLIEGQADMEVVAEADNGEEAVRLARTLLPDVAVVDISMPGLSGTAVAGALRDLTGVRVVGLTRHNDRGFINLMVEAGAVGYVLKQSPSTVLIEAIRTVASGDRYFDPHFSFTPGQTETPLAAPAIPDSPLSGAEEHVLRLIASGYTQAQIVEQLAIPREDTEALKESAMRKLHLNGRAALLRHAQASGWFKHLAD